jgi:hypothetical protein
MISKSELSSLTDELARKFEETSRVSDDERLKDGVGWGQFLDNHPEQRQIGPYGTCSGLIVRALARRGADQLAEQIADLLSFWWAMRNTREKERTLFSQTTRSAILLLSLRIADMKSTKTVLKETREYLISALRSDRMWGNYAIPGVLQDATPRLFPTAIALLSFALFSDGNSQLPEGIMKCADKLEERLLGAKDLPALHIAAAAAAILAVKNGGASKKFGKFINRWAYATQPALPELGVYFYDLEFAKNSGERAFDRDYFIVPTEVLVGIAGFQKGAPANLRLRAESSMKALVENMRSDGFYRPDDEQRVSSLNQCWVAIYLALGAKEYSGVGWWNRTMFWLLRERPDSAWRDGLLLALCSAFILLATFLHFPTVSVWSVLIKIAAVALTFLTGHLYAPAFMKKVFVGRE